MFQWFAALKNSLGFEELIKILLECFRRPSSNTRRIGGIFIQENFEF